MVYFAHVIVSLGFMSLPSRSIHKIICRQLYSIIFYLLAQLKLLFQCFCLPFADSNSPQKLFATRTIVSKKALASEEKNLKLSHNLWLIKCWTLLLSHSYRVNMNLHRNIWHGKLQRNMHACGFMHNLQCKKKIDTISGPTYFCVV